jgi:uncharacterized protein (TIGR00297 family)
VTIQGGESARKAVHLAVGGFAFLLRDLTFPQAAACAAGAMLFNRYVLGALGGGALFRGEEIRHPWRSGIVLYPMTILILILLFHERMEVVAASWGILAAGDSAAGVVGRRFGAHQLPWNRWKTLEGTMAFAISGSLLAWALLVWMRYRPLEAALLAGATGLCGALVESLPWKLDDNLTVPILSALFLRGLLEVDPATLQLSGAGIRSAFLMAVPINLFLAFLARRAGTVDRSGLIAGFLVGTVTLGFSGVRGYLVLLTFFVLGSAATRLGYRRKARLGIAQAARGARSARHALANCGVALYLAFLIAASPAREVFVLAFVCAYATAAFDTISSEVGQAYGGRPVLITTLRPVPAGTDGGVTWIGTLAGSLAAVVVAEVSAITGFLPRSLIAAVALSAFAGSTVDSLLGATLERKGFMDNDMVNFSNTLIGALTGIGLATLGPAGLWKA